MRILASFCVVWMMLSVLPLWAEASDLRSALEEGIDPEQGLSAELVDEIGPYEGTVSGFGARLLSMLGKTLGQIDELGFGDGLRTLGLILASALFCALLEDCPRGKSAVPLVGGLTIAAACVRPLGSMIALGTETIRALQNYCALLLPGMGTLMASSGSLRASAVSGLGMVLLQLLLSLTSGLLVPLLYLFLLLSVAEAALGLTQLSGFRDYLKWLLVTGVKLLMWAYAAIMSFTGLISGAVDGQKLRSVRSAIAGMVPVVGNIVSEASASLISVASQLRTGIGLYGMLAVFGICFAPFVRMGLQYLLLRLAAGLCSLFGKGSQSPLLEKLSQALGLMLALSAIACLLALMTLVLCIRTVNL